MRSLILSTNCLAQVSWTIKREPALQTYRPTHIIIIMIVSDENLHNKQPQIT